MNKNILKFTIPMVLSLAIALPFSAHASSTKLAYIADDLSLPIWVKTINFMKIYAKEKNIDFTYASSSQGGGSTAEVKANRQINLIKKFISQGYTTIGITASDSYDKLLSPALKNAHEKGVKIVCYDRLINDAYVDTLLTFDNIKVGQQQAKSLLKARPNGNYYLLGGSPTDNNAISFRLGQYFTLMPFVKKGNIKIIGHSWTSEWNNKIGYKNLKRFLKTNRNIDAVVASNDGLAGAAVRALRESGIKNVVVSGQDSELSAVKHITKGQQLMTIYKSPRLLSHALVDTAIEFSKGVNTVGSKKTFNGKYYIHTRSLNPIVINKSNIKKLINDGAYTSEEIYGK